MYKKWNGLARKALWWIVLAGVLAAVPIGLLRMNAEATGKKVEFVFDYRDLLEISEFKNNPAGYMNDQLNELKKTGIHSLAVYESSINELRLSRKLEVYSSKEARILTLSAVVPTENFTYVLFADAKAESQYKTMITKEFTKLGVPVRTWSYKNQNGLVIEMPVEDATIRVLDPDLPTMQVLKDQGFKLTVRLSNRREFNVQEMDTLLGQMKELGVSRLIIDGPELPGFNSVTKESKLHDFTKLLNKHGIGLAAIELQKEPQKGFNSAAKETHYNIVRLHSFSENDATKLSDSLPADTLKAQILATSDRFVLAVKDRNIRMVLLNARAAKNLDKARVSDPIKPILASLTGPDGAQNRILKAGFTLGPASSFSYETPAWTKLAKIVIFVAGIALIVLTVSYFEPAVVLALFILGLIGSAGLYVLSPNLYAQALALATAICAPSLAIIKAIQTVATRKLTAKSSFGAGLMFSYGLFLRTVAISLIGVFFIFGLLNNITYLYLLEQFRGVSLLHLLPIAIAGLYLLFFTESLTLKQRAGKVGELLKTNINILWVVTAALALGTIFYYLTRTGNAGQASAFELYFRSFLENTLGVRPRSKEFLLAHPIFLLGGYIAVKYRSAVYLLLVGVIGQLSMVDTFAHLHTPIHISAIRDFYGIVFGSIIGFGLIVVWEILVRGWNRWAPAAKL